jgi:multimeric flavodoxin WrbA
MTKILAINGSYRDVGVTDKTVELLIQELISAGAEVESILLRDYPIEFCLNCRECTQQAGEAPGKCVLDDGMHKLVEKIEQADAYIFASPTNFGSVTALFKRFMERLIVYGYWPWGSKFPKFRKEKVVKKKAILVSSCGAPGLMGRWLFGTYGQLKKTAQVVGADPVGEIFTGLVSTEPYPELPDRSIAKIKALAAKLV